MTPYENSLDAVLRGREVTNAIMSGWDETRATVAAALTVSRSLRGDDQRASLAGWDDWVTSVRPGGDAVLLDNTTVVNAMELIAGARPTATSLLDLNTLLTAVTYYDCAVRLEHPDVEQEIGEPVSALNRAVGAELVRTLPVAAADRGGNPGVVQVLHAQWEESVAHVDDLNGRHLPALKEQEIDEIRTGLETVLGRAVPEPLFDLMHISTSYGSDVYSPYFLTWQILDADPLGYLDRPATDEIYRQVVTEAAVQTGFNCQLANALNLPYLPNQLRTPYRALHYRRDRELTRWLGSGHDGKQADLISELNWLWRQPLEGLLEGQITLPLPLSYCLARLPETRTRPDDWFSSIGDLRTAMSGFRAHRQELQDALDNRDAGELGKLAAALQARQQNAWREALAQRWLLAVPLAVVTGLLGGLPAPILVAVALASGFVALPDAALDPLRDRLGRRRLRFASDVGPVASQLVNWLPAVTRVWRLGEPTAASDIETRLAALRKLERRTG